MQTFSVEYIEPLNLDGPTTPDNLAYSCQGCNNHKYNKTQVPDPVTNLLTPLFNPRLTSWNEHCAWSDDFSMIVGLTPTGRATVEALQLYRDELVNLRKILFVAGEHPSSGY